MVPADVQSCHLQLPCDTSSAPVEGDRLAGVPSELARRGVQRTLLQTKDSQSQGRVREKRMRRLSEEGQRQEAVPRAAYEMALPRGEQEAAVSRGSAKGSTKWQREG